MPEVFKINDIDYLCEFKLSNPDGQEIEFTKSAIREMTIVDSVFDPFIQGSISVVNPYDYIEDDYFLRGDGRDEFRIMFHPVDQPDRKFDHLFAIVGDSNYGNPDTRTENTKTFTLVDKSLIPFMDLVPYLKRYSGKVGDIIKEVFKEVLGDDKVDEEEWESGDIHITYTPPATFRYLDLLYYLMRHFVAKDGDLYVKGLISFDNESGKFRLKLLTKIFEDNKKNLMEAFSMGDLTNIINLSNPNNPPPDGEVAEYIGGLRHLGYSVPFYEWNANHFLSALVHGYDPIMGTHKIRKLDIEDIKEKWKTKFVDVFKSVYGKPKPFLVSNKTTSKRFKHYRSPRQVEDTVRLVESELYSALTFYNLQCSFFNIGDSGRAGGKFIDIFKTNDEVIKSDEKILGRWFVTEIHHVFMENLYQNRIFGTKTYVGPNSNVKEDVD